MDIDTPEHNIECVWEMIEKMPICMLTTWTGAQLRGRPMDARPRRKENAIYFLTDARHHKDDEIAKYPQVMTAHADTSNYKFVSLSGSATISNDRAKIKELWEPTAQAWWKTPEDPNIRVLVMTPESAEYWDSPGKVISLAKMLTAAVTGSKPDVGTNKKVEL